MQYIKLIGAAALFVLLLLVLSCDENPASPRDSDFYVDVVDSQGNPLEGVIIRGGIDWDFFSAVTDSRGRALLPRYAYGKWATLRKNQYYSISVEELKPGEYMLRPTPYILNEIGQVEGKAVKFESDRIITVDYDGEYRVYSYDENGVTEEISLAFPYGSREYKVQNDTLWFSTYDGDIYAYYLTDAYNPVLQLHLDIDEGQIVFDWSDSIMVVGPSYGTILRPIRILSFHADSSFYELDRIENFIVNRLFLASDYLVALCFDNNFLTIFDISNPLDARLIAVNYYYNPEYSFLWGDTLGLAFNYGGGTFRYNLIEFSDPANPEIFAGFLADGRIFEIIDDTLAVGRYCTFSGDYGSLCVFKGNLESFQAIAILSEEGYPEDQGSRPPYFIMGGKLWILEDRQQ